MKILTLILTTGCFTFCFAQSDLYKYEPSKKNPYGIINPEAPKELADFAPLIGDNQCKSVTRNGQGGWADTVSVRWRFKYILDGLAVQDETLKADGKHTTSIRQYDPVDKKWYVTFFSTTPPFASPGTWKGEKVDGKIILYNEQTAPNGTEGFYKITFSDISEKKFNWLGEWVDKTEKFSYPTWYLFCTKKQ
ncbi:MAG: hypothetical protein R2820_01850 [Cyclobacteriaceae bacterium]